MFTKNLTENVSNSSNLTKTFTKSFIAGNEKFQTNIENSIAEMTKKFTCQNDSSKEICQNFISEITDLNSNQMQEIMEMVKSLKSSNENLSSQNLDNFENFQKLEQELSNNLSEASELTKNFSSSIQLSVEDFTKTSANTLSSFNSDLSTNNNNFSKEIEHLQTSNKTFNENLHENYIIPAQNSNQTNKENNETCVEKFESCQKNLIEEQNSISIQLDEFMSNSKKMPAFSNLLEQENYKNSRKEFELILADKVGEQTEQGGHGLIKKDDQKTLQKNYEIEKQHIQENADSQNNSHDSDKENGALNESAFLASFCQEKQYFSGLNRNGSSTPSSVRSNGKRLRSGRNVANASQNGVIVGNGESPRERGDGNSVQPLKGI